MINFDGKAKIPSKNYISKYHDEQKKTVSSDTGELELNYGDGIFTINTEKTQAAVGFMKEKTITLKNLTIKSDNEFCSIAYSVLDDRQKVLLTAAARIENKNQKYNESKTQLASVGDSPVLVEGVSAKIILKNTPRKIIALDINGNEIKSIPINGKEFSIKASDNAFFYELTF